MMSWIHWMAMERNRLRAIHKAQKESLEEGNALGADRDIVSSIKNLVPKRQLNEKPLSVGLALVVRRKYFSHSVAHRKAIELHFCLRARHISILDRSSGNGAAFSINWLWFIHSCSFIAGERLLLEILFLISPNRMIHYEFCFFNVSRLRALDGGKSTKFARIAAIRRPGQWLTANFHYA